MRRTTETRLLLHRNLRYHLNRRLIVSPSTVQPVSTPPSAPSQWPQVSAPSVGNDSPPRFHEPSSSTITESINNDLSADSGLGQLDSAGMSASHLQSSAVPLFDVNWDESGVFQEINQILGVFERSGDVNAQLDQLMNINFLSELESGMDGSDLRPSNTLLNIRMSDDNSMSRIDSGPSPSKHTWRRL